MVRMGPPSSSFPAGHSGEILSPSLHIWGHGKHHFPDFLEPGSPVTWENHRRIPAHKCSLARESSAGNRKPKRHAGRFPCLSSQILLLPQLRISDQEYSTNFRTVTSNSEHSIPPILENRLAQKTERTIEDFPAGWIN